MDLTPTPSTTKRIRNKAASAATKPATKLVKGTVTAKPPRSRKKAPEAVSQPASDNANVVITSVAPIDEQQINAMIATAAYYLAVQRDFAPGNAVGDWLAAEQQVLRSLD